MRPGYRRSTSNRVGCSVIDQNVFKQAWALLSERFGREQSDILMKAYYDDLSPDMDTESFRRAVRHVFRNREFFPRPIDFIDAVRPDVEAEALGQWELAPAAVHDANARGRLTKEARRVIDLIGGFDVFRQTPPDGMSYVRREFMQLYGKAVEIARREAGERIPPSPEAKRMTEAAMKGPEAVLALARNGAVHD